MSLTAEALKIARTHLNDDRKLHWSDPTLMPKARQAHRELQLELVLNGIAVVREVSADFSVAKGAKDLGADLPTDLVDPIRMWEKGVGEPDELYREMDLKAFIPTVALESKLRYWCWREEVISFLGATEDRVVRLMYKKGLSVPNKVSDPIGLTFGELFIGPRIAAIVAASTGKDSSASAFNDEAYKNLDKIIRANVLPMQRTPVRKRPFGFRLRRNRRIF